MHGLSLKQKSFRGAKMAFGLYSLLEACLLVVNAMAVLNEERFLSKSKYEGTNRERFRCLVRV